MFYSSEPEKLRAFIRDVLGFKATDIGEGWLIFDIPEADMGCHPADSTGQQGSPSGTCDISFYCDDIQETMTELKAKGVSFRGDVEDHGYGWVTFLQAPGNFWIQLYQPKYDK